MMTATWQQLVDAVKSGALGANSAKYSSYALDPNYTGDRNDAQWSDYVSGKASGVGGPTSIETTEMGKPNNGRPEFRIINTPDGKGGVSSDRQAIDYSSDSGNAAMNAGVMAMLMAMGGAAIGGAGAGAAGAGEGAGAVGGMETGATGAFDLGGIAGGVEGAGGATGLGSTFGLGDAALGGTLSADALAGYEGLTSPGVYDAALDLPGGLDVGNGGLDSINDLSQVSGVSDLGSMVSPSLAGDAATFGGKIPTSLVKAIAGQLLKPSAASGGAASGGAGGSGVAFNAPANETPGMLAAQAAPQTQQQAIAQALMLGGPNQPQFNGIGYMPVSQGYEPNSQMMQLAQALQQDA